MSQFHEAALADPQNSEYWLDLAISQDANGATTDALASLHRAISLDAFDYRPYLAAAKFMVGWACPIKLGL